MEPVDPVNPARQGTGSGGSAGAGTPAVRTAPTVPAPVRGEHTHAGPPPPAARPVVRRSSVRGQVLEALRASLVTGELRPGEVYSAPALGERLGVSATPVREAMQQLAQEGAVEVVPNRGFRVVERGARELAELAEIRALIEVPVLLRLARAVPAERWAELRPLAEATVRAASSGSRAVYAEADRAFHRAVLMLAGNEQLVRIAHDLHRRAQWPPAGGPAPRGRADLVADAHEHTTLLDALIAGDRELVRTLVTDHFTPPHVTPEHSAPPHATPERSTPPHVTPPHVTPPHATPERPAPGHGSPRHVTPHPLAPERPAPEPRTPDGSAPDGGSGRRPR